LLYKDCNVEVGRGGITSGDTRCLPHELSPTHGATRTQLQQERCRVLVKAKERTDQSNSKVYWSTQEREQEPLSDPSGNVGTQLVKIRIGDFSSDRKLRQRKVDSILQRCTDKMS
jgi:hypothetical protein